MKPNSHTSNPSKIQASSTAPNKGLAQNLSKCTILINLFKTNILYLS